MTVSLHYATESGTPEDLLAPWLWVQRRLRTPTRRRTLQRRIKAIDWSWHGSASTSLELYRELSMNVGGRAPNTA